MKPQPINPAHSTRRNRVIAKTAKQKSVQRSGSSSYQSNTGELLNRASKAVKIKPADLQTWFESFPNLSDRTRDITLQLILQHRLDPRADEIDLVQYEVGYWQALITVNGWAKLINAQPAFCGIEFTESTELEDDIPRWMSCTIYRTDRIKPISVKEYFVELKTQHSCWQEMPRRMLRHRAMQQCARLAFGITVPDCKPPRSSETSTPTAIRSSEAFPQPVSTSQTSKLKAHLARLNPAPSL